MDTPLLAEDALVDRAPAGPPRPAAAAHGRRASGVQATRPDYFQGLRDLRRLGGAARHLGGGAGGGGGLADNALRSVHALRRTQTLPGTAIREVEVRLKNYSYGVPVRAEGPSVRTVFNQSPCYVGTALVRNAAELVTGKRQVADILGRKEQRWILRDIDLVLKPGRTYVVMGPPG